MSLCSVPLSGMKGSNVESGRRRKLSLPFFLGFARVYGTLCVIPSSELSAICLNPRRESGAQPSRLLIALSLDLSFTQFSVSVVYYRGLICTAPLSCHFQGCAFPTMGSCLGSLNHAAPWFCRVLLRGGTKSMKSLADLARDLKREPLNAWPCKDSFHREVLSPSSVNWKTVAAEMTWLFNLLYISLYQVRLGPHKEMERSWRMTGQGCT